MALLVPAVVIYFAVPPPARNRSLRKIKVKDTATAPSVSLSLQPKHFVTMYRGAMMVITCVAILAVDFRVFPRRFAKVETWGTSVMDLGVGSFVFTAGVVAARPVLRLSLADFGGSSVSRTLRAVKASSIHAIPLVVLGIVRLLSVKGLDYAEHVTEYGVHWNFFFTLALLGPAVALVDVVLQFCGRVASFSSPSLVSESALAAMFLVGAYEIVLGYTPLKYYIFAAPRTDIISMNREGICSFVGYLGIFLAGRDLGLAVLPRETSTSRFSNPLSSSFSSWWRRNVRGTDVGQLAFRTVLWTGLYIISTTRFSFIQSSPLQVSRRLANLPYLFWVSSYNSLQLFVCAAAERICFSHRKLYHGSVVSATDEASSKLHRVFNSNGLAVFLIANVLTGLVNLALPTINLGPTASMAVLLAYTALLAGIALEMSRRGLKLKI